MVTTVCRVAGLGGASRYRNGKGYFFLSNAPPPSCALRSGAWQFLFSGSPVSTCAVDVKHLNETTEWSRMLQVSNNNNFLLKTTLKFVFKIFNFNWLLALLLTNYITWSKIVLLWVRINFIFYGYWFKVTECDSTTDIIDNFFSQRVAIG